MSAYESTVEWLYALDAARGMDFKLERVQLALNSVGNPHRRYRTVHIAGTNGKGSVAAMIHAILTAAGYRVGRYTSPHLVRFTERIRVGRRDIAEDEVVDLVVTIRSLVTSRGIDLTFFELATVMAFMHFATYGVDLAVIEVGLGGRLDATNVIDPLVSVVTTIGLDHQEYLGSSIEQIAAEKGGIIKPRRPTVLGRMPPRAREVLRAIAAERASVTYELGRDFAMGSGGAPTYTGLRRWLAPLALALRGGHQRDNAATALATVELLAPDFTAADAALHEGLAHVHWPGRLETIGGEPPIILDGAHNPDGVETLVREVQPLLGGRRVLLLFGVMRDKPWAAMARMLSTIAAEVTVTTVYPPRGESGEQLAAVFRHLRPTSVVCDPAEALAHLRAQAGPGDVILVTGSLFLIGAVYPHLRRTELSPGAVADAGLP